MEKQMVRKLNPPRNYPIPECACCDAKDERIRELEKALRKISDGDYSDAFELHSVVTNALDGEANG
jgi:hypothetical protein